MTGALMPYPWAAAYYVIILPPEGGFALHPCHCTAQVGFQKAAVRGRRVVTPINQLGAPDQDAISLASES
jgi:hypothetical protein